MFPDVVEERELVALIALGELLGVPSIGRDLATASILSTLSGRRIAIAGIVKRGKSTLVNTLLGTELSPVNFLPETSSVLCFAKSASDNAFGITFDGRSRKLSTKATAFSGEVSREAKRPLLAATFQGDLTIPNDFCLIDTPGAHETEVAKNSMVSSGMPQVMFSLCDGYVVVLGVPGVSATDISLLEEVNRRANGAPVRILLKALDSGISHADLKEYANNVLDGSPNQIFVVSDDNQSELTALISSFRSVVPRGPSRCHADSASVVEQLRDQMRSILKKRDERHSLDYPRRLLKDLPDDVARLVSSFAPGEWERREAEREKAARKAAQEAFKMEMSAWNGRNSQLLQDVRNAQSVLNNAQENLRKAKPSMGCGAWVLLAMSCAAFPVGPIIVGAILWFANSSEEKNFAQARPRLQNQIDNARDSLDRANRLFEQHQTTKPRQR